MTAPALLPLTPLDWMRDAACAHPDVEPKPCGTPAAYKRHRTRGENCEVCKRANREYYRQIEAARRAERGAA